MAGGRRGERVEHITSRHNPLVARLRKLGASRSFRRIEGADYCGVLLC